ncbi:hypothetical protein [Nitrosovibrio sp. Nv4]|uniref:hypothetical protein n=1 Tax=Nitrosovibrio sp. Nv4 TaxID=1945880 RepID=UPI000BD1F94B|nr:hypothetical protein [Nitrosovibrio sp. Nv4]SOD42307.1 hypothetical protein SAMN06298226_2645 [Nitrosovibrio sp. Nv4]
MKLQVNLKGAWREVLSFSDRNAGGVCEEAARLGRLADRKVKFRIADDANRALAHCEGPYFIWSEAGGKSEPT